MNRHLKEKNVFGWRVVKFCENFSLKQKLRFSLLCDAYNYMYISMPIVATYRVKVERIILCVKIVNQYFESKESFLACQFRSFDGGSVRIKGARTLYLALVHSKHIAS